jgi:hypothetical protein
MNPQKTREIGLISRISGGSPRVGTNVYARAEVPPRFQKVLNGAPLPPDTVEMDSPG